MKSGIIAALSVIGIFSAYLIPAAAQEYNVSLIPEELKENASAVVRKDVEVIDLNNEGTQATLTVEYAITILDKSGDDMNGFEVYYDKSSSVSAITARMYDSRGEKISNFSRKEFSDIGIGGLSNMYDDTRVLIFNPVSASYPYTIEYSYTWKTREFLSFPSWVPVEGNLESVEHASLSLIVSPGYRFDYKAFNLPEEPERKTIKDREFYTWTLDHFKAVEEEPFSPHFENYLPELIIRPENFSMEGYTGSFTTWSDFARWAGDLTTGRDVLPDECVRKVHEMTDTLNEPYEKISMLYRYMQKNTRYVSIQLGIGGYQPFDAATVYQTGYGDCKALSNYMKALLKEAGINAYYTLAYAGRGRPDIKTDFPSQQFNHAILCVPVEKDTVWLECTSSHDPAGYIAGFTDDRHVLVVDGDGGTLVKTKSYPMEMNRQERKAEIIMNPGLDMTAKVKTLYTGTQYNYALGFAGESFEEQKKKLLRDISVPEFVLNTFHIGTSLTDHEPAGEIDLDLKVNRYVKVSGDRVFLPLNLMNRFSAVPKTLKYRERDVYFSTCFTDTDSIEYTIPEGYEIEFIPAVTDLSYDFGDYHSEVIKDGNKLLYIRKISREKGIFPKEIYPDVIEFYRQVAKADNCKALLKKSGGG